MSATTIYNSYTIALPSVQVAVASGQSLLSRAVEAVARRIAQSILNQPVAPAVASAPLQWRAEAALRQQGMREWLETQSPAGSVVRPVPGTDAASAQVHKALWLELVG